jgi:succinate-acetate transporter protein
MSTAVRPASTDRGTAPAEAAASPTGLAAGDPAILGLPMFVAGSVSLALALVQWVPPAAAASALPIIMAATGLGLLVSAIWAMALGQTLVACIFGLFAGFWWSYSVLVLGLNHNWFAIPAADVVDSIALFQLAWAIAMGMLTLATLKLPVAFTAIAGLVVVALIMLVVATKNADADLTKAAGYVVFAFAALGVYLFLGAASAAAGGKGYPLGPSML